MEDAEATEKARQKAKEEAKEVGYPGFCSFPLAFPFRNRGGFPFQNRGEPGAFVSPFLA